ncbi:MAG TPA: response regulator [Candidatus Binataceae bacterium]|nr:response regulator [Candidatus Binataceae bacterium]
MKRKLPIARVAVAASSIEAAAASPTADPTRKNHLTRVLLIEDSEHDADLIVGALQRGGFALDYRRVLSREAIAAAFDEGGWDLAVADYSMPHFSGLEALKLARELGLDLPFILVSRTAGEEVAVQAIKAGADYYVLKNDLTGLPLAAEREIRDAELRHQHQETVVPQSNLCDRLPVGIYSITREGKILEANPAFVAMHGFATLDALQEINLFDFWVDKVALARMRAMLESDRVIQNFEVRFRRPDGSTFWCSLSGGMAFDEAGNESRHEGVAVDTTERRVVIEELQRGRDLALEAASVRSDFLARMSHEIRTPLNAIIGTAELLALSEVTGEQRRRTEVIQSSGKLLLTIVDDILDFSKLSAGKVVLEKIAFDPVELVEELVDSFEPLARPKHIELAAQLDFNLPTGVIGDPNRLRQILNNLISNAVKFTPVGDVLVRAAMVLETSADVMLRFEVIDSGIGIAPEARTHLFQPFIQADGSTSRRYGGTGLGLVIAAQLTAQMGGEIGYESAGEKGTAFHFTARFGKDGHNERPWMRDAALPAFEGQFLIASGSAMIARVASEYLSSWGILNQTYQGPTEVLEQLRSTPMDDGKMPILILDDNLSPVTNSLDIAMTIKRDPLLSETRIVMLSSGADLDQANPDIDQWLTKPLQPWRLFACLRRMLGERDLEAETAPPVTDAAPSASDDVRVLVVEDDETNRMLIEEQLLFLRHRVELCANAHEGLDALSRAHYDLVLMDCGMPEMDGYEATAELRRREGVANHTTVVALTAHAAQGDRERCLKAGMDDYLSKPVTLESLTRVIDHWTLRQPTAAP